MKTSAVSSVLTTLEAHTLSQMGETCHPRNRQKADGSAQLPSNHAECPRGSTVLALNQGKTAATMIAAKPDTTHFIFAPFSQKHCQAAHLGPHEQPSVC